MLMVLLLAGDKCQGASDQTSRLESQGWQYEQEIAITGVARVFPDAVWNERVGNWTRRRRPRSKRCCRQAVRSIMKKRIGVLLCRTGLVAILLVWSGGVHQAGWYWGLLGIPVLEGGLPLLLLWCPGLAHRRSYWYVVGGMQRLYVGLVWLLGGQGWLGYAREGLPSQGPSVVQPMLVLAGLKIADEAQGEGWQEEDGTWHVELRGTFIIRYKPGDEFEKRVFLHFLRQIRSSYSKSERPFIRQTWLAEWFGVRQELVSRWEKYVREGGLLKLRGEAERWVLTPEVVQAILDIWVPNFWLSATQVRERLVATGQIGCPEELSEGNIHRVAQESGFAAVRQGLRQMFQFKATGPQWQEEVLIQRLFEVNQNLIERLQAGAGLTPQLTLEMESLKQGLGVAASSLQKPLPLAYQMQRTLFGQWQDLDDGQVRCPYCGSTQVTRKENKPRIKKYRHPQSGQWQEVEGYCYFCRNTACPQGTFTDYPDGVRLYSNWPIETMLWGVMVYMQMRTTYRRAAQAVGVSHVTLWRWAMVVGQQSLPIATLFGVVRSSGVIGVDEKWVLVPKNDKPAGKRQRWMYVYLAVDVHTYDLLHIDIFPYNNKLAARAFLQALKAKGYQPQVIITDMNQDYADPIAQVFPQAKHHECVFHALQWAQRLIKDVYGNDYAQTHPQAAALKQRIYKIFAAKSRKTVNKRYLEVMALKPSYVAHMSEAQRIFDFLERHYPKLVNAIEDPLTPLTNNAVELVIRRFDQHYQNMTGFDSIETARIYLNLFELSYRFTPFAKDNRPVQGRKLDIRGKCPLELAGYDISQFPLAQIMRSQILGWPPDISQQLVPNT